MSLLMESIPPSAPDSNLNLINSSVTTNLQKIQKQDHAKHHHRDAAGNINTTGNYRTNNLGSSAKTLQRKKRMNETQKIPVETGQM